MLRRLTTSSLIVSITSAVCLLAGAAFAADDELYGPTNLVKTMKTPFGFAEEKSGNEKPTLSPLSLDSNSRRSLSNRLLPPRLYLPGRMVLGQTAEFTIKGKPGSWVALGMADRDSGAKPILGHPMHLGPDRKLVGLTQIPDTGVASLVIETPIQGDLIGQQLYFEAALWSKPDFSDLEIAAPVPSDTSTGDGVGKINGVTLNAESDKKRGIRIVPDGMVPAQALQGANKLDSGRP